MKKIIILIAIVILVILFGTWPLSIIGKVFEYLGIAFTWLAKGLNIFGWNGILY